MSTLSRSLRLLTPVIILTALFLFPSCEEEGGELEAVVIVKYLGDTSTVVPGAEVILEKNDIYVKGFTDEDGRFSHVFQLEAILDVIAKKDTGIALVGNSVIRLKPDKTVYRTVYLGQ